MMAQKTQPTSVDNVGIIENSATIFCDCYFDTGLSLPNVTICPENNKVHTSKNIGGSMEVKNGLYYRFAANFEIRFNIISI